MNHPDRGNYDLSTLTDIAAGGAPRPVAHVERLRQSFPNAQPALGYGLTETNAVGCGNFWGNYAAKPASTGRAQMPFVELAILGEGDRASAGQRARRDRHPLGRQHQRLLAQPGGDRGGLHRRRLFQDRRHRLSSTRTAICSSSTARRTSSSAAARISRRPRSRRRSMAAKASPRRRCSASPDDRLGEVPVAILHRREGSSLDEEELRAFLDGRLAAFKVPARMIFSDEPLAPARHRQDRPGRAQAAIRRLTMKLPRGRPPHPADRRRRGRRADRRLPRLAAAARAARCGRGPREAVFGPYPQDRDRRAGDAGGAAGRDRAGHLDRPGPDRRRRTWRGMGECGGRAGAARRRPMPTG